VAYAAEVAPATDDAILLSMANREGRIFLTADLDVGELIYRQQLSSHGIVLLRIDSWDLRIDSWDAESRLKVVQETWGEIAGRVAGQFVVVADTKLRIRPLRRETPT
jgi:predicted nuclease of predicted toxin-antitoxin system